MAALKKSGPLEQKYFICSKCGSSFDAKDISSSTCSKCKGVLEAMEGFYERHPELKEKIIEKTI
jgi:transcription initiation factor IIE alpha subunit